ncbi:MAG TPA: hypothetical protein VG602_08605 [Actinomycetota bacterium]|nr:hypothetical protein [Actinomycetota bacterium]
MNARLRDERGFVIASLLRMTLILLILGLVAVEGGSILYASLSIQDAADAAAINAADQLRVSRSPSAAQEEASRTLGDRDPDAQLVRFEVLPDSTIKIRVRKQASTIFVHRIGFLEDFAVVEATSMGRPPTGRF